MVSVSESDILAAYLRSQRTLTQEQVDRAGRIHDADTIPPQARFSARQAHTTASPAAH